MTNSIFDGKKASAEGRSTFWLGRKMLVHYHESGSGYLAMEATVLAKAFEDTANVLGIDRNNDLARLVVAKHIIIFAKAGERDPTLLRDLTVKAIRQEQRRPRIVSPALILIHP